MSRQQIIAYGPRGRRVNVFRETVGVERVRYGVEWREWDGRALVRRSRLFPGGSRTVEREAKQYAQQVADVLELPPEAPPLTVGQLWSAYRDAHAADWRPATAAVNDARWQVVEALLHPNTVVERVRGVEMDRVRTELLEAPRRHGEPMARNQVAHHLQLVKTVWAWAAAHDLIPTNPLQVYRIRRGRDYRALEVPEFSEAQWGELVGAFDPRRALEWRPWVVLLLAGLLGQRAKALLKLRWEHVDLVERVIRWPADTDKLGRRRVQPLPRDAVRALRYAKVWRAREAPTTPYVVYGAQRRTQQSHWRYQAAIAQLRKQAERLNIPMVPYQGLHALRRMRAKSIIEQTGNVDAAAQWLGNHDLGTLKRSYLRDRPGDLAPVAARILLPDT